MKTRDALEILSKGNVKYEDRVNSTLLERAAEYIDSYNETESAIADKKASMSTNLPFVEALKRKVSKLVSGPDQNLPIITRFDLYQGVRKIAERTAKDTGLQRLSTMLEKNWHDDPMGTLTYSQVSGLVKHMKDQFPRSVAADAIEAECTRVGLHKLPVAKLARIAKNINSQEDYDSVIESSGYAGDRPEQIRARALVRSLVALRDGDVPESGEDIHMGRDLRSPTDRVADKLAQLDMPEHEHMEEQHSEPMPPHDMPHDVEVSPEEVDSGMDMMEEIEDAANEIVDEAPPEAQDYIEHEMSEGHTGYPGTAEWGAEEILMEGHTAPPPSDKWLDEEMHEIEEMQDKHAAKKGKGIPLPPKAKSQPKVTTYAPKMSGGGKVLKASEIEDMILSGKKVVIGSVSIHVNSDDEVELWNKDAGQAASLLNLDQVIADFAKMVNDEKAKTASARVPFKFAIAEIIDVPCEMCGDVNSFMKSGSVDDEYACTCGHLILGSSYEEFAKVAQYGKVYQVQVTYPQRNDNPNYNKQARDFVMKMLGNVTSNNMRIVDDSPGLMTITTSHEYFDPERAQAKLQQAGGLQQNGGTVDVKRIAQGEPSSVGAVPAMPAVAPMSPPANATPEIGSDVPAEEAIAAALTHYKSTGLVSGPAEAISHMLKDYKEREDLKSPENQAIAMEIALELWGGGKAKATDVAPAPMPAPAPIAPVAASKVAADSKMKSPSIRKPKDHVSVPKDLGKDSETHGAIPTPSGKIKQQHKPDGKMSDKELGKDSETQDLLPSPGKINERHEPSGKMSDTDLGDDSEGNDPFKTPSLGNSPSVKK